MTRIRLQIQVLPWEDQGQAQENGIPNNQCEIKPWLQPEDPETPLLQLVENIARRFSRIYVGRGNIRVKELQDYWGNTLDLSDKIQDVFDDRLPSGDNLTSICKVLRYAPEPAEIHNPYRFASLLPESTARPQKRPPPPLFDNSQRPQASVEEEQDHNGDHASKRRKTGPYVDHRSLKRTPELPPTSQSSVPSSVQPERHRSILQISDSQNKHHDGFIRQAEAGSIEGHRQGDEHSVLDSPDRRDRSSRRLIEPTPKSESPEIGVSVMRTGPHVVSYASEQPNSRARTSPSASIQGEAHQIQVPNGVPAAAQPNNHTVRQVSEGSADSMPKDLVLDSAAQARPMLRSKQRSHKRAGADIYDPIESDTESFYEKQQMFNGGRRSSGSKTPRRVTTPFKLVNETDERAGDGTAMGSSRAATKVRNNSSGKSKLSSSVPQNTPDINSHAISSGRDAKTKRPPVQQMEKVVVHSQPPQGARFSMSSKEEPSKVDGAAKKNNSAAASKQSSMAQGENPSESSYVMSSASTNSSGDEDIVEGNSKAPNAAIAKTSHPLPNKSGRSSYEESNGDARSPRETTFISGGLIDYSARRSKAGTTARHSSENIEAPSANGDQPQHAESEAMLPMDDDPIDVQATNDLSPKESLRPPEPNDSIHKTVNGAKRRLFSQPSFARRSSQLLSDEQAVRHSPKDRASSKSRQTKLEATPVPSIASDRKISPSLNYNQRQALARKQKDAPAAARFRESMYGPSGMLRMEPESPRTSIGSPSVNGSALRASRKANHGHARRSMTPHLPGRPSRDSPDIQSSTLCDKSPVIAHKDSPQGSFQETTIMSGTARGFNRPRPTQIEAPERGVEKIPARLKATASSSSAPKQPKIGRAVQTTLPVQRDKKLKGRAIEKPPTLEPTGTAQDADPVDGQDDEPSLFFSDYDPPLDEAGPSTRQNRLANTTSLTTSREISPNASSLFDPALPASQVTNGAVERRHESSSEAFQRRSSNVGQNAGKEDNDNSRETTKSNMISEPPTTLKPNTWTGPQTRSRSKSSSKLRDSSEIKPSSRPEVVQRSDARPNNGPFLDDSDSSDSSAELDDKSTRDLTNTGHHVAEPEMPKPAGSPRKASDPPAIEADDDEETSDDDPNPTPPAASSTSAPPAINVIHTSSSQPARRRPYKYPSLTAMSQEAQRSHPSIFSLFSQSISSPAKNDIATQSESDIDEDDGSEDDASEPGDEERAPKEKGGFLKGCSALMKHVDKNKKQLGGR